MALTEQRPPRTRKPPAHSVCIAREDVGGGLVVRRVKKRLAAWLVANEGWHYVPRQVWKKYRADRRKAETAGTPSPPPVFRPTLVRDKGGILRWILKQVGLNE